MFEFLESKANELIDSINSTANGMSSDSEAATTQATDNESQASQLEAQAAAEEASCPHYKEETRTVTVDDGDGESHTETETETVPDPAADASSRAKASSLRAQAATLKAAAAALRALASALRAQLDAIKAQRQRFADAIAEVNQKAEDAKQKLNEGTGFIVGAIRAFSVPIVSGAVNMVKNTTNSILGNVGIDLSDGFDEKDVYGLTGWIAKTTVDTGAFAVKTFVSTTVASTLGGGMIGTTGAFVVGKVVGPTIDEAFGEKAVDGVHTFLTSALEFFGIKAKPDEKETATAQFYLAIRSIIYKQTQGNAPDAEIMNRVVEDMVKEAITCTGIENIVDDHKSVDLFSDDFLAELDTVKMPITKFNALLKLLRKAISAYGRTNKVKAVEFDERLRKVVEAYNSRDKLVFTSEVVADFVNDLSDELIKILQDLQQDKTSFEKLGISYEEKAFYDILVKVRDDHGFPYEEEKCLLLAKKIKELVDDKAQFADWSTRDDIKNQLNMDLTVLLYKNGYPPEWDEEVFEKVMEQAENFKKYADVSSDAPEPAKAKIYQYAPSTSAVLKVAEEPAPYGTKKN